MSDEHGRVLWKLAFFGRSFGGGAVFLFGLFSGGLYYVVVGLVLSSLSVMAQAKTG
jgi:hypothetical protein